MNSSSTGITALILVDIQNDFLEAEGLSPSAAELIEGVEKLLAGFRLSELPVVHVRTLVHADGSNAMPHRRLKPLCVEGTHGADFPDSLKERPGELVASKQFFDGFADPSLNVWLKSQGVTRVVVCGLFEYACVRETSMAAYEHGYEVFVPSDAVTSDNPEHAAFTRVWMNNRVAEYKTVAEILRSLGDDRAG